MRPVKKIFFLIIILILALGCQKILFNDNNYESFKYNFEMCWNDIDLNYAHFQNKNINWDSIYEVYLPRVKSIETNDKLFLVLSNMLNELKDNHVNLFGKYGISNYQNWYDKYLINQINFEVFKKKYLQNIQKPNDNILIGKIIGKNIGYIYINSFNEQKSRYTIIDNIINNFSSYNGAIIDVRSNPGGFSSNADTIASRFTDSKRLYSKERYRDGYNHDDFTKWYKNYIEPTNKPRFLKPVVVLTNRGCASACEYFILMMKTLPNTTLIGDYTLGLVGQPIFRELPIGWEFRFSNSETVGPNSEQIEDVGISPDININIPEGEQNDLIVEKAIELLSN